MISVVSPRCTVMAVPPSQRQLPWLSALAVRIGRGWWLGRGSAWATVCCGWGACAVLVTSLLVLNGLENGSLKREVSELQPAAKAAINPMPRMRAWPRCIGLRIRMATHSNGNGTAGVNAQRVNVGLRKPRQVANLAYGARRCAARR